MNPISPHIRLRSLYNKYLYLDDNAYYDKKRFYEQNESDVRNMKLADSLWIESGYLEALFKISEYGKFCQKSQIFLERLIYHNISYFNGEQIFEDILHKRAASFYQLRDYDSSIHNARELIKINPDRKDTQKILFYALRSSHKKTLKIIKACLMAFFLAAAVSLMLYQIIILSFFPEYSVLLIKIICWVFIPAFVSLIGAKIAIDVKSFLRVKSIAKGKPKS